MPKACRSHPPRRIGQALVAAIIVMGVASASRAETALVAVAANFAEVVEALAPLFSDSSGHDLTITTGSTGKLYAQILAGAPFDVLLAADRERPARLEAEDLAVDGSRFTYAIGRLTLWSPEPALIDDDGLKTLDEQAFRFLAIANPELAPYGLAAVQTLDHFGLKAALEDKLVMGQNIGQAFAMVATGNAELGLVAKSQAVSATNEEAGSRWDVPAEAHAPIRQQAVLLRHGAENPAALAFLTFLRSEEARERIEAFGYGVD